VIYLWQIFIIIVFAILIFLKKVVKIHLHLIDDAKFIQNKYAKNKGLP